ncbi:MAG TPA: cation:proton antiporter [Gemmatimonadales bacterium]|nr:cation:proton antiporter [Gemmatimonadales bacterium]
MSDPHDFLRNLVLVLGVAAAATILFQRLRQPVVFGYLIAGMILGPYVPIPVVADEGMVRILSELGVILLMFALGLEFSLRKLLAIGPTASVIAVLQTSAMVGVGFLAGRLLGWTVMESVYAGAIIAISSTTIIVKAFSEQRIRERFTGIVFGVLIMEDLIAIFLLAILTAISADGGVSPGDLLTTASRLGAFLAGLLVLGLLTVPRLMRTVVRLDRPETTVVTAMGICFAVAYLAQAFHYSVALGAFLAGSLVAESGEERAIEQLVQPIRDMFAAIFFVAVGMLIDPRLIVEHWRAVVVFTLLVVAGKILFVSLGAFLAGYGTRTSVQTGMSLAQIGEFSFIIAGIGLATGATREFIYPIAVAVSAITTLSTPWLIRAAGPAASWVDRKLPRPLQTFAALYGSWMASLRSSSPDRSRRSRERRLAGLLAVDAALLAAIAVAVTVELDAGITTLSRGMELTPEAARAVIFAGGALLAAPLVVGMLRTARALGQTIALRALPAPERGVDFGAAPRRAFLVTWQLVLVAMVGVPLVALSQPFLPAHVAPAIFLSALAVAGIAFWRSATNLQGHTRAGAEVIVAALARQMAGRGMEPETPVAHRRRASDAVGAQALAEAPEPVRTLAGIYDLIPGLGQPVSVEIGEVDYAAGRSLAELDLRDRTEATVLVIVRPSGASILPVGAEVLRPGDLLALAGTADAVNKARVLLHSGPVEESIIPAG